MLAPNQQRLPALEARIAADRAKFTSPPDPHLGSLVLAAQRTERKASLLSAEENLLHAQQQLAAALAASGPGEEETRDKKVATAREKLAAATKALTKPTEGYTPVAKPYPTATTGRRLARTSPQAHHSGSVLRTSRNRSYAWPSSPAGCVYGRSAPSRIS